MRYCVAFFVSWCSVVSGQSAHDQELAAIREYSVNYGKNLPAYTCVRQIEGNIPFVSANSPGPARDEVATQVLKEELTVAGPREAYKLVKLDDHSPLPSPKLQEFLSSTTIAVAEFGRVLDRIFEPASGATVQWARTEKLRGRPVLVFAFDVPPAHGERIHDRGTNQQMDREIMVGFKGRVYADAETKAVLRVETHTSDFPKDAEYKGIDLTLDYKAAKIDGREYVLPYHFEIQWHRRSIAGELNVQAEFKDYRAFTAPATVSSGGVDQIRPTVTFGTGK